MLQLITEEGLDLLADVGLLSCYVRGRCCPKGSGWYPDIIRKSCWIM